ncbi:hypothetical protein [Chamaesiphon polymorphus]|uniref:Outer membrane protein beta-barrel domain-containing protein n=1 Tax=Chamaesiphon polymorphus CCALA 037 TaxID=2107692 RepID=A0A2T1FJP5_9CYAN|nr:hypothetical protein [Chamaesiphon polymorphus]PSB45222.1 hypothetical protein C7B77_25300 [Chamaesiphon polymorphus CCALA 037]
MKKHKITSISLLAAIATVAMSLPASAQVGQSSIGPSLQFGNGQAAIGIDSKFGVSENLSLRPFIYFPNNGTNFGTALTYDLPLRNTDSTVLITPFIGGALDINTGGNNSFTAVSLVGGADFDLNDSLQLKTSLSVPLSNNNRSTSLAVGAGFRF